MIPRTVKERLGRLTALQSSALTKAGVLSFSEAHHIDVVNDSDLCSECPFVKQAPNGIYCKIYGQLVTLLRDSHKCERG